MSIFHSFEAGIANAISSFKWMKNNIIYEKRTSPKLNYLINWASTNIFGFFAHQFHLFKLFLKFNYYVILTIQVYYSWSADQVRYTRNFKCPFFCRHACISEMICSYIFFFRFSVENSYLEEKEDACCALGELAVNTGWAVNTIVSLLRSSS